MCVLTGALYLVFCTASPWGLGELLTGELGCFCLKGPELRLQKCSSRTAVCALTPCACITSHHASKTRFEGLLLLGISSLPSKPLCIQVPEEIAASNLIPALRL